MTYFCLVTLLAVAARLSSFVHAHGNHNQQPMSEESDWATTHMQKEHHISNFDATTFFFMHDFDSDGFWEPSEIRRSYGFDNDGTVYDGGLSVKDKLTPEKAKQVVNDVLELYDHDEDIRISKDEWLAGIDAGKRLPDFGLGPGHHGDDEYEYEIHHYEKYHDENTKDEDLVHEEDHVHFRKHDERELADQKQEKLDAQPVVEANIPPKFRRN